MEWKEKVMLLEAGNGLDPKRSRQIGHLRNARKTLTLSQFDEKMGASSPVLAELLPEKRQLA